MSYATALSIPQTCFWMTWCVELRLNDVPPSLDQAMAGTPLGSRMGISHISNWNRQQEANRPTSDCIESDVPTWRYFGMKNHNNRGKGTGSGSVAATPSPSKESNTNDLLFFAPFV